MKNGTVQVVGASRDQLKEIYKTLLDIVPNKLSHTDAQRIIAKKGKLQKKLRAVVNEYLEASPYEQQLISWQDFYREHFGIEIDFSEIELPETKDDFDRLIIVARGMTMNQVFKACEKHFTCWKYYDDLDKNTPINDRPADKTYAIAIRDRVEADEEYKNLSANELTEKSIKGITLLERLVLELKYFTETGSHLDISNITLCSGSCDSDGDVPFVRWRGGEFGVDWYEADYSSDDLRCREVV